LYDARNIVSRPAGSGPTDRQARVSYEKQEAGGAAAGRGALTGAGAGGRDVDGRDATTGPAATGPLASATSAANGEPLRSMSATAGQLRSRGVCLAFSDYIFYAASS